MPTVHRQEGYRFVVYPNDHRPPHVHVFKAGGEAIILIGDDDAAPSIRERKGMSDHDAIRAVLIVEELQAQLLQSWRSIHG